MMKKLAIAAAALALVGCAVLQFSEVSPRFSEFHPTSIAVLPFTNTMGMENANDMVNNKFAQILVNKKFVDRIADPSQVKQAMASNEELATAVTNIRTKWVATGISDKNLCALVCKSLNCDSLLFGEITAWNTQTYGLQKTCTAGLALRWVDKSGEILWKASHSAQSQGMFSSPDDAMQSVINMIIFGWPKQK